jgi:hypothetical protein
MCRGPGLELGHFSVQAAVEGLPSEYSCGVGCYKSSCTSSAAVDMYYVLQFPCLGHGRGDQRWTKPGDEDLDTIACRAICHRDRAADLPMGMIRRSDS